MQAVDLLLIKPRGVSTVVKVEMVEDGFVMRNEAEMKNVMGYIAGKFQYVMETKDVKVAASLLEDVSLLYVQMFTGTKKFDPEVADWLGKVLFSLDEIAA